MKMYFFLPVILFLLSGCDDNECTIIGQQFTRRNRTLVFIEKFNSDMTTVYAVDSAWIENGTFEVTIPADTLNMYRIRFNDQKITPFYAEEGHNCIIPANKSSYNVQLQYGTPHNEWLHNAWDKTEEERAEFIKNNIQNALGVYLFDRDRILDPEDLDELLARVPKNMEHYLALKSMRENLKKYPIVKIGGTYIDFETKDLNENPIKLSDIAGKGEYVVLYFAFHIFETRDIIRSLNQLHRDYEKENIHILFLSYQYPEQLYTPFRSALRKHYIGNNERLVFIADEVLWDKSIRRMYKVGSVNYWVVIGPEGNIAATNLLRESK